jgi:outer membrane receptor protein involved in Fe transport
VFHLLLSATIVMLAASAPASQTMALLRVSVDDAASGRGIGGACVLVNEHAPCLTTDEAGLVMVTAARPVRLHVTAPDFVATMVVVDQATRDSVRIRLRPAPVRVDERVVVAGRLSERRADVPRSTSVVTRNDIEHRGRSTTPDALMDSAGVLVQKTNMGAGSPYIRGLMGNQVLVLVDGIRLNNATYRYGPNQYLGTVDTGAIDRIEVVRGPGSVLYGSDAIGGVVSVETRRPLFTLSGRSATVDGRAMVAAGSPEQLLRTDATLAMQTFALRAGVAGHDTGDIRTGQPAVTLAPSGYREGAADAAMEWQATRRQRVSVTLQTHRQQDVPRWDQVMQRGFARYDFEPQARHLGVIRYTVQGGRLADMFSMAVARQQTDEGRYLRRQAATVETREADSVQTTAVVVDARRQVTPQLMAQTGAEVYHDQVRSRRTDVNLHTGTTTTRRGLYPDGATSLSLAAFSRVVWTTRRFSSEAGLRFTEVRVRASDATFRNLDLSPRAVVAQTAASWQVTGPWRLFGSVAQSFRAPNIDDVSSLGQFDSGIEVPAPNLAPERGVTTEVGLRLSRPALAGSVVMFRTDLRNLIDRVRASYLGASTLDGQPVFQKANVAEARILGWEAETTWLAPWGITVAGHVTATRGDALTRNEPMRRIPPVHGGLRLEWPLHPRTTVSTAWRVAGAQRRLSSGDLADHRISRTGTPGWSTLDLFGRMQISTRTAISLGVRNLLDQRYRIHGSGLDAPGRTVWLSLHLEP